MIRNNRRYMAPGSLAAIVILLLSCGKESSDSGNKSSSARQEEQVEGNGSLYRSQLLPLNSIVAGNALGVMEWSVGKSQMRLNLSMSNTPEDLEHFQGIHEGSTCPSMSADTNVDGIIDMAELIKVSGPLVLPLDSQLDTSKGDFSTSRANEFGNYTYWSEVRMKFSPANKVVVVYGINPNYHLPDSVITHQGSKHRYVPISCGVIKNAPRQNFH